MTSKTRDEETYPTAKQWAEGVSALRKKLMTDRQRIWPHGSTSKCPACSKNRLCGRDDLMREQQAGSIAVINHNLHGARCDHCGEEFLEPYEEILLEEQAPYAFRADYFAKVTNVSGRNLGTYWPKDVVRVMDLHSRDELRIQILDQDTLVATRRHAHHDAAAPA